MRKESTAGNRLRHYASTRRGPGSSHAPTSGVLPTPMAVSIFRLSWRLEVMEEDHVTVDGVTHDVGAPFMVIATQNPIEQAGTYRLPEAQLDRFIMKTSIGYPDHASTLRILQGAGVKAHEVIVPAIATAEVIVEMGALARTVHVDPSINDYVSRLVDASRNSDEVRLGASVRAALALVRTAKTLAAASGRHFK